MDRTTDKVEIDKDKVSRFIVTGMIASLSTEGIMNMAEEQELSDTILSYLEGYVLGKTELEWASICYTSKSDEINHDCDYDFMI
ncbi:hypothetical protein ACFSCX_03880 [Bacillus salitolerans]|uniref:Uncharacterized protein n=1 Tax=Bacillus salitolerans TaxID=1437434 RepID=A0ABW4LKR1_9BACI